MATVLYRNGPLASDATVGVAGELDAEGKWPEVFSRTVNVMGS